MGAVEPSDAIEANYSKVGSIPADYFQVSFGENVRLSPLSTICGRVDVGSNVTVFAGTQVRGDCAPISIGDGVNLQENCCLHVSGNTPLRIGDNVTVGHGAILHGCTIEDNVLVGMGSIVMDNSHIAPNSLVAAGAVVTEGKSFPPRSLIMGSPARVVRELADDEVREWVVNAGIDYVQVGEQMFQNGLLAEPPAGATIWPQ